MKQLDIPANLSLLILDNKRVQALRPVKALDIYDGGPPNFHPDGLFSTEIFGRVGEEDRDLRFSYIDIKTSILHPLVYQHVVQLKGLYEGIMQSRAFAIWDEVEKDFVTSDELHGDTGYAFFLEHWLDIVFKQTGSEERAARIKFVEKFRPNAMVTKIPVIPAGFRDIEVDATGRTKEGEINEFYRSLLSAANAIGVTSDLTSPVLNNSRYSLQLTTNKIYGYLNNLISGKGGFIQEKWGARRIFNGTRNVITASAANPTVLTAKNTPEVDQTIVGLYQQAKAVLPLTKNVMLTGWLSKVFKSEGGNALLVNPATLQPEEVTVSPQIVDRWFTSSGIESVINSYAEKSLRFKPVVIDDYYLGLIYRPKDRMVFRIFNDIRELPEWANKTDVHPLTLAELIYLSGYQIWNKGAAFFTRYPITGIGSIYPCKPFTVVTTKSEVRRELADNWEQMPAEFTAIAYPVFTDPMFVDAMSPHSAHLVELTADFDGDTGSYNALYGDEAVKEIHDYLDTPEAYVKPGGGFRDSPVTDMVKRVLVTMTGD